MLSRMNDVETPELQIRLNSKPSRSPRTTRRSSSAPEWIAQKKH